jgi:hypothetical protein
VWWAVLLLMREVSQTTVSKPTGDRHEAAGSRHG